MAQESTKKKYGTRNKINKPKKYTDTDYTSYELNSDYSNEKGK